MSLRDRNVQGRIAALCVLVALLPSPACTRSYELTFGPDASTPTPEVLEVWQQHRDVLVRILQDRKFTLREFSSSVEFFERTTCLPSHHREIPIGKIPGDTLEQDLADWDGWLSANGSKLYVLEDGKSLGGGAPCPD